MVVSWGVKTSGPISFCGRLFFSIRIGGLFTSEKVEWLVRNFYCPRSSAKEHRSSAKGIPLNKVVVKNRGFKEQKQG